MKVKTVSPICRSVCVFNPTADMRKHIIKIVLCAVLLGVFAIGYSQAGTWRDDFSGAELNGWERIFEEDPWFADWGLVAWGLMDDNFLLFGEISMPKQEDVTAADFLHWNIQPFQLDKLKVVGEEIRYTRLAPDISGELCLFLGKRQSKPDFAEGYIFSPEKATKIQFNAKGVYKKGEVKAEYAPMFRLTSGDLKVFFDTGTFQIFTQDLFITEFSDAEITTIDVVGLMIMFEFPGRWFDATISAFSVSGEGIPNYNSLDVPLGNTQLTTTWGELKRF